MRVTGLKFRIESRQFEECLRFYTEYLGMKMLDSWDKEGDRGAILGFSSASAGEAFLELAYVDAPTQYDGISLQFRVPDLAKMEDSLRGLVNYRGPDERPWGSTYLYLMDPAGVPIIIYEGEL